VSSFSPVLDPLIHVPARLQIMAIASRTRWSEFRFLRDHLELSDSALSKHISALEEAGYIEVVKDFVGKRGRTRITITDSGREAYDGYVVTLLSILDPSEARPHVSS
jgi:DNA-binding MarR family transcriptional regulator